jgi:putative N-acetylmannosamine-6-phosphate epimerase
MSARFMRLVPRGGLIVSCQARADNPLHGSAFMTAMARAAVAGGAVAVRANGPSDIAAIKAAIERPVIGLLKRFDTGFPVAITPSFADAAAISAAGADIIAFDATARPRGGESLAEFVARVRSLDSPLFADVATLEDGVRAAALGVDCVATTLSGYTDETRDSAENGPDFSLIEALAAAIDLPVIAEGRFTSPEQVGEALRRGAYAVVVGTAITNPREITRRFVDGASP